MKRFYLLVVFFVFFLQNSLIGRCETLFVNKGFDIHNDREAMDFAWTWFNYKDYDKSEQTALIALNINSENVDAYNLLGMIALRKNKLFESVSYFEKAYHLAKINNMPNLEYLLNNLGFAYYINQRYEKSLNVFEDAYKFKSNWISDFGLAISYYALGRKEEAAIKLKTCRKELNFNSKMKHLLEYFNISLDGDFLRLTVN